MSRGAFALRSLVAALATACACAALLVGCAAPPRAPKDGALRISQIDRRGDARRQASTRLVVEGLEAELASAQPRALSRYQRAIQIDPSNPFAYLALARYYAAIADPGRTLQHLDRAQSLLDPDGDLYPSTEPHLLGLRGWALAAAGRPADAGPLLAAAARLAPSVWADGRLDAGELR